MQPNQPMPQGQQPIQQNYQMQQGSSMQCNNCSQQNYQMQQQNSPMQQNFPMQQNYQNQQNLPNQNQQTQINSLINFDSLIPSNQQPQPNFQNGSNSQTQFNQSIPQIPQQNSQNQFNSFISPNQQNQQNFQAQPNQQMQGNSGMQSYNAPLTGSQSRPIPPLPKNPNQSMSSMQRMSSQRIPLQSMSSMNGSNGSTTFHQSMQFNSMASMQSLGSSDSEETQQPLSSESSSQIFPVVYNNITYKVDPVLLSEASPKVKEMLIPIMDEDRLEDAHLEILVHNFTYRNVNNFLKLCQNQPTDVENSEMEEICEIAKLFGAEKIYNTGITFIRQNIDPNFTVPDSKYDGSDGKKYLYIEDNKHAIDHSSEIRSSLMGDNENDDENSDEIEAKQNPPNPSTVVKNDKESGDSKMDTSKIHSVIYRVKVEKHALKCPVFHFYNETDVLFTAKQKDNNIYIGEGYDVHINSNKKNHVAHISQDDYNNNIIYFRDKNFKLQYVGSGRPNHLSLKVTFPLNENKMISWTPKQPKYDPMKDKYYLNFHGEQHHHPIKSKKNIVLQNDNGHPTFIVRKMNYQMYEIECLPIIDPLIVFTIGISDIVGPYQDPCGDILF